MCQHHAWMQQYSECSAAIYIWTNVANPMRKSNRTVKKIFAFIRLFSNGKKPAKNTNTRLKNCLFFLAFATIARRNWIFSPEFVINSYYFHLICGHRFSMDLKLKMIFTRFFSACGRAVYLCMSFARFWPIWIKQTKLIFSLVSPANHIGNQHNFFPECDVLFGNTSVYVVE